MRAALSILFGSLAAYISQNIAASNGYQGAFMFIALGVAVAFICYNLIGVSDG